LDLDIAVGHQRSALRPVPENDDRHGCRTNNFGPSRIAFQLAQEIGNAA
jgi:hypothetical protein